jgi:hypothetical protein
MLSFSRKGMNYLTVAAALGSEDGDATSVFIG